jgi:glycosyltransferase involved in cell wall biosynthesis
MPRLSVALCTWNGEKYLRGQLDSIASQTRLPDELLIQDDGSTDRSVPIAEEFAAGADFPVEVRRNQRNVGYIRNFQRVIRRAGGEVIVLADQDDLWHPERLERIDSAFAARPELGLFFSDAELVDARGAALGERLWDAVNFTRTKQRMVAAGSLFEALVRGSFVTGATLAFAARYRERVLPLVDCVAHDAWISLILSALAPSHMTDEPLVQYRQHGENQIGAQRMGAAERLRRARGTRLEGLEARRRQHAAALQRLAGAGVAPERLELLRESIRHLDARIRLPEARPARLPMISRELSSGRYSRASEGVASAARDLLA